MVGRAIRRHHLPVRALADLRTHGNSVWQEAQRSSGADSGSVLLPDYRQFVMARPSIVTRRTNSLAGDGALHAFAGLGGSCGPLLRWLARKSASTLFLYARRLSGTERLAPGEGDSSESGKKSRRLCQSLVVWALSIPARLSENEEGSTNLASTVYSKIDAVTHQTR